MKQDVSSTSRTAAVTPIGRLAAWIGKTFEPASRRFAARFDLRITILAFGIVLVSLHWGAVILKVQAEREAEIRDAMKETANLARAFEEHTKRTIREADQLLLFIMNLHREQGEKLDLRRLMEDGPVISRIYTYLSIVDERGMLVSGSAPFKPTDLSDLDHFRVHVAQDTGRLYISKPVVGRTSGKQSIQLSRRINKPDLSFGGVAVASVDPEYFAQFYGQLDLGKQGLVTLVGREDGIIRARRSGEKTIIGQSLSKAPLFNHLRTSDHGSYMIASAIDGVVRIISYRTLADYPLVVAVGVSADEALAAFNQRARYYHQATALASLVILGFIVLLLVLISRREKTDNALRDSEQRYRQLVHALPAAVYTCDAEGRITLYNEAAAAMWGREPEIGKDLWCGSWQIYNPDDGSPVPLDECPMALTIREGRPIRDREIVVERPDGARFNVLPHPQPMFDASGATVGAVNMLIDITGRKRAEAEHAQLAAIVESSDDAIISRSLDRKILTWNAAAERLFGWSAGEAIGHDVSIIIPPDRIHEGSRNRELLHRGLPVPAYDTERVTKSGRRVDVSVAMSPVRNPRGEIVGVSLVFHDIAARRRTEAESARLAAIVESSDDAIISRSRDGIIQSWNAAAERMFGWSGQEAVGQSITILVPPERRGELRPLIERVMVGETVGAVEATHRRKNGARIDTSVTFSAIRNAAGDVVSVSLIYRDITVQARLERESQRKAKLTQLMESLARTVNQAASPEEAMRLCLDRICEHGRWTVGRFARFGSRSDGATHSSIWNMPDSDKYSEFLRHSGEVNHTKTRGWFIGRLLREKRSVWVADISRLTEAGRLTVAAGSGLRTAFAFPIIAHGDVVAFLEFLSEEVRDPDEMLLESIGGVGSQLARLIERHQSESALRASEARMRAILDAEPECVKVVAADGTLLNINRAGLAMFEAASIEQAREHGLMNFLPLRLRTEYAEAIQSVLQGESRVIEIEITGLGGTRRLLESHLTPFRLPENGAAAVLSVTRDITERARAQEQIAFLSQYDTLTGLPNRNLFRDRLELSIARARRQQEVVGILLFNLDRFKQVNEGLGLEAGDDLLRQVAARLKDTLREVDTIARLGSDEFAILVEGVPATADVTAIADKLLQAFTAPFKVKESEVVATPSLGITFYPNGTEEPEKLLEHAETALERAKREGGGSYRLYEDEPTTLRGLHLNIETRLRYALERGELELHYQPKVRLADGVVTGAEALLRWNNPELGPVSPAKFIPIAEESGLIVSIGEWVLRTACARTHSWHQQGLDIGIAVNLSPRQFRQKDLVSTVVEALKQSGLAPQHLELEITEGTAMANAERAISILGELHELGIKLSVDDFGTGYSSLAYLKRFPLDCLKIDRSFVLDVGDDANSEAIVRATIALAQSLKLKVVAEGVETEVQRGFLASAGCDEMQGYLYSRPLPAAEFLALVERARNGGKVQ